VPELPPMAGAPAGISVPMSMVMLMVITADLIPYFLKGASVPDGASFALDQTEKTKQTPSEMAQIFLNIRTPLDENGYVTWINITICPCRQKQCISYKKADAGNRGIGKTQKTDLTLVIEK
jgi:hypothetical protein